MKYLVTINRKYQYIKVYNVLKKMNESTNALSRGMASFINGLLNKKKAGA
jgi:hypothetical protein